MIEIRKHKLITFIYDIVKVTFFFILIFYAAEYIYEYALKYIIFMISNNLSAELSPLILLMNVIDALFSNFYYDLGLALAGTFLYSIKDKYIFQDGFIYTYEGIIFTKERTIPYNKIIELDYERALFDTGGIVIKVDEKEEPIKIKYISHVLETFKLIENETKFEKKTK